MRLIFLACLLVLACIGSNTVVARNTFTVSNLLEGANKKSSIEALYGDDDDDDDDDATKYCNSKRFQASRCFSCSKKKNTTTSDDKRVVPTGPNPLHNSPSCK